MVLIDKTFIDLRPVLGATIYSQMTLAKQGNG